MTGKDNLIQHEKALDAMMQTLPIFSLPLRTVLTAIFNIADSQFNGNRLEKGKGKRVFAGEILSGRLSYLLNLLSKCPLEPLGISAFNALSAINTVDQWSQVSLLLSYTHFSEIMPEVHRGYYTVTETESGYELSHSSLSRAEAEILDILMSELALPFFSHPNLPIEHYFTKQANLEYQSNQFNLGLMSYMMTQLYSYYIHSGSEWELLSEAAMKAATGASVQEFLRFRAAWMSIGEYCLGIARAYQQKYTQAKSLRQKEKIASQLMEWTAVFFKDSFIGGIVRFLTGLDDEKYNSLMQLFVVNPVSRHGLDMGDGFFPPLWYLSESFLFNPNVLQTMLGIRNVLYAVNKRNRTAFDELSKHLEPQLIHSAKGILESIKDVIAKPNVLWEHGEIDLLVFRERDNVALNIQAKAFIPPQGARMVRSSTARMREGVEQIKRFRQLTQEEQDAIISRSFGDSYSNVEVLDVLLSWSGFGSEEIWRHSGEVTLVNPALLRQISSNLQTSSLSSLPLLAKKLLDNIRRESKAIWVPNTINFGGKVVSLPVLEMSDYRLEEFKRSAK